MIKPNNIPLPNLTVSEKLLYSILIAAGLALFIGTWVAVLWSVYTPSSASFLGEALGVLASDNANIFYQIFLSHAVGMFFILATCFRLFSLTSLRRKTKKLIFITAVLLTIIDLSGWGYAPSCSSTNLYVGIASSFASVPLIILGLIPLFQMWVYKRCKNLDKNRKKVIFIGGGFAGLYAAMGLNKSLGYHPNLEITLLDRRNYFLFPPLLPSAAAGTIETRQVTYPFRRIFETTNIIFRKVDVFNVDPVRSRVTGLVEMQIDATNGESINRDACFDYDYLVIAPGSTTQTFNTPGAEEHAYFMRELNDAVVLRNKVIDCFETAAVLNSPEDQKEHLSFVVVGAGPTGIETATEIYDLIQQVLLRRYPEIDKSVPNVTIVQSGSQILPGWDSTIVSIAEKQLRSMNVNLILEDRVLSVDSLGVSLKKGGKIISRTVIWCAGVKPSPLLVKCGLPLDPSGRITVDQDLRVPGFENIFAMGDAAHFVSKKTGKPLPPLGQVAFQQGSRTANNLVSLLDGRSTKPFSYFDFGGLVSVGEHFAAVNLLGIRISGFIGWFIWRTLYLVKLVGLSNKIRVMIDWTLDLLMERSFAQIRDSRTKN